MRGLRKIAGPGLVRRTTSATIRPGIARRITSSADTTMSNVRLIAHSTPVSTGGRTSNSGDGLAGHEHARSSSSSVVVGTTRRRRAVRTAGVDERDELGRGQLEAGHDDVVGAVLGHDLLEIGERAEGRGVGQRRLRPRAR